MGHAAVIWTGLYSAGNITYNSTTSSCDCQVVMGHSAVICTGLYSAGNITYYEDMKR